MPWGAVELQGVKGAGKVYDLRFSGPFKGPLSDGFFFDWAIIESLKKGSLMAH